MTTNIACRHGGFFDDVLYAGNNLMQRASSLVKPFATGMFMLFDREAFWRLGGFNERALFAEDYLLSKGVARRRFRIVRGRVLTTNRRFQKLGHGRMVWMFFKTMVHSWDDEYFLRDQGYWEEVERFRSVGLGEAGAGEELFVDDDEEAFGAGEDGAVGVTGSRRGGRACGLRGGGGGW